MKFTPLAIKKQQFKRSFRGYSIDEVRTYLELLSTEYEALLRENSELKEKVALLESEVERFRQIEKNLQMAVTQAQETANKTIENSKKQAELIVKEAELKAREVVDNARSELQKIKKEIENLKTERERIVKELLKILRTELEKLEAMETTEKKEVDIEDKIKLDDIIKNLEQ